MLVQGRHLDPGRPHLLLRLLDLGRLGGAGLDRGLGAGIVLAQMPVGLPIGPDMQHRGRNAAHPGEQPRQARGEAAIGALVHGNEQALQIGDEAFGLELLALQPLLLLGADGQAPQRRSAASAAWPKW